MVVVVAVELVVFADVAVAAAVELARQPLREVVLELELVHTLLDWLVL